jgi:hypothetical protein
VAGGFTEAGAVIGPPDNRCCYREDVQPGERADAAAAPRAGPSAPGLRGGDCQGNLRSPAVTT